MTSLPDVVLDFKAVQLPAQQLVLSQGQQCEYAIVVMSGKVKVYSRSPDGREILLYNIEAGEMCVLTTSCLLDDRIYPAEAMTETAVEARLIPYRDFQRLLDSSASFRTFVFKGFGRRMADLMMQLEYVALESIDQRLIRYLLGNANARGQLFATHQDIAAGIGSAREVVSRHLKTLEKQQLLELGRGLVALSDRESLQKLMDINS